MRLVHLRYGYHTDEVFSTLININDERSNKVNSKVIFGFGVVTMFVFFSVVSVSVSAQTPQTPQPPISATVSPQPPISEIAKYFHRKGHSRFVRVFGENCYISSLRPSESREGAISFLPVQVVPNCVSARWADLDGDSQLDLLLSRLSRSTARQPTSSEVWISQGDGTFTQTSSVGVPTENVVEIGDLYPSSPGEEFIAQEDDGQLNVWGDETGDGEFQVVSTLPEGSIVDLADLDSRPGDEIVTRENGETVVLIEDGSGIFTEGGRIPTTGEDAVSLADLGSDEQVLNTFGSSEIHPLRTKTGTFQSLLDRLLPLLPFFRASVIVAAPDFLPTACETPLPDPNAGRYALQKNLANPESNWRMTFPAP